MSRSFIEHYRCPKEYAVFEWANPQVSDSRNKATRLEGENVAGCALLEQLEHSTIAETKCLLPFDPDEAVTGLRFERYVLPEAKSVWKTAVRNAYYVVRPALPVPVRRHLQRLALKGWDRRSFPQWPVDRTVENIFEKMMSLSLKAHRCDRIPFVWFWPEGMLSCAIMTHDVETASGLAFCEELMNVNDSYGIKSSFQIIPESRYATGNDQLFEMRRRGFEINVHDLTHDGYLYDDEDRFQDRAARINQYAMKFGSKGFRSGVLYRNLNWYGAFQFSYDMSVPNVGHLDPQPGGCCTTLPYFIGDILELPLTTIQDYSLFNILGTYSTDLWQCQIDIIRNGNGLMSFNVHPDYLNSTQAMKAYKLLLETLANLRSAHNVWIPLPGEVDTWWRQRSQIQVVRDGDAWRLVGPGAHRARLAFASLNGDSVTYSLAPSAEYQTAETYI